MSSVYQSVIRTALDKRPTVHKQPFFYSTERSYYQKVLLVKTKE